MLMLGLLQYHLSFMLGWVGNVLTVVNKLIPPLPLEFLNPHLKCVIKLGGVYRLHVPDAANATSVLCPR